MTAVLDVQPRLSELDEAQRSERFGRLQDRLPAIWHAMRRNEAGESIVVLPSVSADALRGGAEMQALEERFLFLLLLLRQPRLQVVYLSGRPIPEPILQYYLGLLPGVIPPQARRRLHMVAADDGSPRPLAEKLLERPRTLAHIRALIPDPALSHLVPYSTTALERDLALALGIPLYGADPRLLAFGTKTGCRRLFGAAGVPHPHGVEDVRDLDGIAAALADILAARPDATFAVVKLNDSASGRGNALVDLRGAAAGDLRARAAAMAFEHPEMRLDAYLAQLARDGGIVEQRIVGAELRSPSVQLRVTPLGAVEVLSTHDQVLGGPSGQRYLGCRFPADAAYARAITAEAVKVGERLAREGVLGRFAVDFLVAREGSGWRSHAIEVNLRKGGTTHPFLTLQFLTDGRYDAATGRFDAPDGRAKHLVATDHLESDRLRGLTVDDLFDVAVRHGLHFDPARQSGAVFHMMSPMSELGRVGVTAVGDSPEEASAMFARVEAVLLDEAAPPPEPALPPV